MEIQIQLTSELIAEKISPPSSISAGAWAEFRGVVRGEENGAAISALEYEAYPGMADGEIRRLLEELSVKHPCLAATVIHRLGIVPVGETAIYVGVAAKHRGSAFALLTEFMNRLKQDVPIWKRRAIVAARHSAPPAKMESIGHKRPLQLNEARAEIISRCQPLPGVRVPLDESGGRVLCETVCAMEDSPPCDRSTRDGYAVLRDDQSEVFFIVDTIHAADWNPRQLKVGEAVRVATGASLPCEHLRVVMQENVERTGGRIKIVRHDNALNVRRRGEELRIGDTVLPAGTRLGAGGLALLASVGCVKPLVSPRLRVLHLTTGDEIISPEQKPQPGQVRDSNSILIHSLLERFGCKVKHFHLPEDFEKAQSAISAFHFRLSAFDLVLVSGGASVGEKDFTSSLLEWLGFEIVFNRLNLRPGAPLIFGVKERRVAFGLPGNPLSHFVCFHAFVAEVLEKLTGGSQRSFQSGKLVEKLEDAPNSRETLWPARMELNDGRCVLTPLRWSSSGDVTVLAKTNALLRIPANSGSLPAGTEVDFLPTHYK